MGSFFIELSLVMIITLVVSFIMTKIKQPLLIGYILTGILAGPLFFNILSSTEGYQTYAHIGVALLLFIVGLHLNLKLIKEIGFISVVVGSSQIIITALFGFLISYFFGIDFFVSFLIAIALSFSSTISGSGTILCLKKAALPAYILWGLIVWLDTKHLKSDWHKHHKGSMNKPLQNPLMEHLCSILRQSQMSDLMQL